ncbi:TonB-dependent receptor [Flavobacteriales bacterium]|nr:TonB-dependent receptor [Flavobacteriales bacterium]
MKKYYITILVMFLFYNAFTQSINGKVFEILKDGTYSPVSGANVYWQGTQTGTVTDKEGDYTISEADTFDEDGNATLMVSYVGYELITKEFIDNLFIFYLSNSIKLDEINVKGRQTASKFSTINSLNLETLSTKELEKAACCNLSESFGTNASVDVAINDGVSGATKIKMLGLDGVYTQITHENMPLIRGLSSAFGLTHVPGTWIESIQIIKGNGSVINGFESFTGQINLEYFKPESADKIFLNLYGNGDGKIENNLILSKRKGNWQSNLFTHISSHSIDHDRNNDGFLDMPKYNQFNFLNRWKYFGNPKYAMQVYVRGLMEDREGGTYDDRVSPFEVNIDNRLLELSTKTGLIMPKQVGKSIGLQTSFRTHLMNAKFGSKSYEGLQQSMYLNLIRQTFINDCNHKLKYGISFYGDNMENSLIKYNTANPLDGITAAWYSMNIPVDSRRDLITGVFSEYNYVWTEIIGITAGVRGDYYNKTEDFYILPRLNLKYNPSESTAIRLSGGRSLRIANPISDNISLLASNRDVLIDETLMPEIAWNYGVNLITNFYLFNREAAFNIDFYRTEFENQIVVDMEDQDFISFYNLNSESGETHRSYANALQLDVTYELFDRFDLKLAYKLNDAKSTFSQELKELPLLPKERALLNFSYTDVAESWVFDFTCNYIGKSRIPEHIMINKEYSNPYNLFNSQITKKFNDIDIYLGSENIFSVVQENPIIYSYDPSNENFDASMIWAPIMGRLFYFGLRYRIK